MNSLSASAFQLKNEYWEREFESILNGITYCYQKMIEDKVLVPRNNENEIRNILFLNYLRDPDIKRQSGLVNYKFDREIPENKTVGRVDIRIISKNDFENDEAYYIIECKRIDSNTPTGTSGLNGEYIKEGIMRFVNGYYASYYGVNGLIGFVIEQIDICKNITFINNLLQNTYTNSNTEVYLLPLNYIKDFEYQYHSIHKGINGKRIKLYHLMFDFSKNIN